MEDKVIVIIYFERNKKTGKMEKYISHGIKEDLSGSVVLENCLLREAVEDGWVRFDRSINEWILNL